MWTRRSSFYKYGVLPNKKNVVPRYGQISTCDIEKKNSFYQVLSPNSNDQGVWVHQDAWFHLGKFESGKSDTYQLKKEGNGIYAFILEGEVEIEGQKLEKRDGFGVWDTDQINVMSTGNSEVLLMEVPMSI